MYVVSLILGICAWCFAVAAVKNCKQPAGDRYSVTSFTLCVIALFFQFVKIAYWAQMRDFAAIDDTIEGVIFGAGVLIGVTIVLNAAAILRKCRS